MKYLPRLDAIRGTAIVLVMLFHFGYFAPGWVGVQLFFVLSGFLITRILLESRGPRLGGNLSRFYWRRSLRILPVLVVLMSASAVLYLTSGFPESFRRDWPWLVSFLANFARLRDTDLGHFHVHMWSLAVEEQFYLVWPFALFLLSERNIKRFVIALLVLTPVLRFVIFYQYMHTGAEAEAAGIAVYVLPFTQFDAFAAGAALSLWPGEMARGIEKKLLLTTALTAVCGAFALAWSHLIDGGAFFASLGYPMFLVPVYGYVWGYSLLNLLFLWVITATTLSHRWTDPLAIKPLEGLGKISYGIYVYHLPMLVIADHYIFSRIAGPSAALRFGFFVIWLVAVVAVASLSFRYIEAPLLRLKDVARRTT
jgi:peptidoglycan/LPS O-acetylase OafA/YrhL